VSEQLPSREQALKLLRQSGCRQNVIRHVEAVSELACEIAEASKERGYQVDVKLVEIGALLHDIGRSKTHTVHHAVVGAEIARSLGLPEQVVSIIKKHVGGGIVAREAKKLGWPKDVYVPQTIEEKIVCYSDKLVEGSRRIPINKTVERFEQELPRSAVERIWKLHEEMLMLVGDCDWLP
jgi:uncharacterized protein